MSYYCSVLKASLDLPQCIENVSHANCPVCLEDIHTSRIPCHIPDCGHLLHRTCFEELLHSGHYACPTCQVSLLDMTDLWKFLDTEVSLTPMPEEYRDYKADILCKDCHEVRLVYIRRGAPQAPREKFSRPPPPSWKRLRVVNGSVAFACCFRNRR